MVLDDVVTSSYEIQRDLKVRPSNPRYLIIKNYLFPIIFKKAHLLYEAKFKFETRKEGPPDPPTY